MKLEIEDVKNENNYVQKSKNIIQSSHMPNIHD